MTVLLTLLLLGIAALVASSPIYPARLSQSPSTSKGPVIVTVTAFTTIGARRSRSSSTSESVSTQSTSEPETTAINSPELYEGYVPRVDPGLDVGPALITAFQAAQQASPTYYPSWMGSLTACPCSLLSVDPRAYHEPCISLVVGCGTSAAVVPRSVDSWSTQATPTAGAQSSGHRIPRDEAFFDDPFMSSAMSADQETKSEGRPLPMSQAPARTPDYISTSMLERYGSVRVLTEDEAAEASTPSFSRPTVWVTETASATADAASLGPRSPKVTGLPRLSPKSTPLPPVDAAGLDSRSAMSTSGGTKSVFTDPLENEGWTTPSTVKGKPSAFESNVKHASSKSSSGDPSVVTVRPTSTASGFASTSKI